MYDESPLTHDEWIRHQAIQTVVELSPAGAEPDQIVAQAKVLAQYIADPPRRDLNSVLEQAMRAFDAVSKYLTEVLPDDVDHELAVQVADARDVLSRWFEPPF